MGKDFVYGSTQPFGGHYVDLVGFLEGIVDELIAQHRLLVL